MRGDDFEQALDEALSSYCDVEPRAGMEARVLYRVRADERSRRRWGWFVLVPTLGALVLAIGLEFRTVPPPSRRPVVVAQAETPLTPAVQRVKLRSHKSRLAPTRASLPRKSEFPTPSPLTPEERAMVLLASRSPEDAQLLGDLREIEPIKIPELRIQPLQSDGE